MGTCWAVGTWPVMEPIIVTYAVRPDVRPTRLSESANDRHGRRLRQDDEVTRCRTLGPFVHDRSQLATHACSVKEGGMMVTTSSIFTNFTAMLNSHVGL